MEKLINCDYCGGQNAESDIEKDIAGELVCLVCVEEITRQNVSIRLYNKNLRLNYTWNVKFGFRDSDNKSIDAVFGIDGYTKTENGVYSNTSTLTPIIRGWMTGRYPNVKYKHLSNDFYDSINNGSVAVDIPFVVSMHQSGQVKMAVEILVPSSKIDAFKVWLETKANITLEQLQVAFG